MEKELDLKLKGKINRLTNQTFKFDERIGEGWFSAVYFLKTREIIRKQKPETEVTMQFFQRENAVLCGTDEAIALLQTFADNPEALIVHSLKDGDKIEPFETVLTVQGKYADFGFLEGIIDGILARRTSVATNVYNVKHSAKSAGIKKPIIFMGDRDDHFTTQAGDGYAAFIGGATAQATHAMNEWWGNEGMGTMPHALIQMYNGDVVEAARAYTEVYPQDDLIVLVDYNNDVINDALKVAREFGKKLKAVRVDTSKTMIDQYFIANPELLGTFDPRGVNPPLIFALREALDKEGYQHVQIVVSGGFTVDRILAFEKQGVPVDLYGVGGSLLKVNIGFTGDNVELNGVSQAKAGRKLRENNRLEKVEMKRRD
ncbi:nicotinate phosphoribosyltransferase [Bacillus sp. JJ664]